MKAYKLFRVNKHGTLSPLFINRSQVIPYDEWLESQCYPTKGFAVRQGWHCTLKPYAPHLKLDLKSDEKRVWCEVEIEDYSFYDRPESQGGKWVLAQKMKLNRKLSESEVDLLLNGATDM